jgi:hypothetical protein
VLFGEVHEMEVGRERPSDLVGPLDGEGVGDRRGPFERLRRLVGVGLDRRDAETLDVVVEAGRPALAEHLAQERPEHAHIGAHALRDLLLGLEAPDEVDRFGSGEFAHGSTLTPTRFVDVTRVGL